MTTHERAHHLRENHADFAVITTDDSLEVRQASAPGMNDEFVQITTRDKGDDSFGTTTVHATGAHRYIDYDRFGSDAVNEGATTISVETGRLDDAAKTALSLRLAALAFELSKSNE